MKVDSDVIDEKDILDAFESGEFISARPSKKQLAAYSKYARNTMAKDKRINVRLPSSTLEALQLRALEEGLPYQTLITSILHKFVAGRLVDQKGVEGTSRSPSRRRRN